MRDAFIRSLTTLAEHNDRVALITGDLGFGVLNNFAERFPNQFINAGVAEQNMTALAVGMALSGWKTYTYSIANFTTLRCLEQIRNDACYHNADVTIVSVGGGFSYGQLGMSHFATEDLAIMRALPNLRTVAPSEIWETELITLQLAKERGPTYLRLDKGRGGTAQNPNETLHWAKARTVRMGSDVTLVTVGAILSEAIEAADTLAKKGIDCRILSYTSLKPFDAETLIAAARATKGVVTVEEHSIIGGLGSAVAETLMEAGEKPGFFRRMGLKDCYPEIVGDQNYLRKAYEMDAASIVTTVEEALG
jgi:transketolase